MREIERSTPGAFVDTFTVIIDTSERLKRIFFPLSFKVAVEEASLRQQLSSYKCVKRIARAANPAQPESPGQQNGGCTFCDQWRRSLLFALEQFGYLKGASPQTPFMF